MNRFVSDVVSDVLALGQASWSLTRRLIWLARGEYSS